MSEPDYNLRANDINFNTGMTINLNKVNPAQDPSWPRQNIVVNLVGAGGVDYKITPCGYGVFLNNAIDAYDQEQVQELLNQCV